LIIKKLNIKSNERGSSTILEVLIVMGLVLFIIFFPAAVFSTTSKNLQLQDVMTLSLQMASIEGGLTDRVEDVIFDNMSAKGLIPEPDDPRYLAAREAVIISSNADARNGNFENILARDQDMPVINISILFPADVEVRLINGISRMMGARGDSLPIRGDGDWYYSASGYILSERVDY